MATLSPNIVSSAVFGVRNYEKGNDGHVVRYAVALGQTKKVVDYVKQLDNVVGQTAKTATQAFGVASKESIFLEGMGKFASFSSTHINPLIIASAGLDILQSDNKAEAAVISATSLGTMFTVENLMKKHLKDLTKTKGFSKITNILETVLKGTKYGKYVAPVIEGLLFVTGSITAYNVGNKIGQTITNKTGISEKSCK